MNQTLVDAICAFMSIGEDLRPIENSSATFQLLPGTYRPYSMLRRNTSVPKRCSVTSITSMLASYGLTRLHDVRSSVLRLALSTIAGVGTTVLDAARADETVVVDNLPFSTVLLPSPNLSWLQAGLAQGRSLSAGRVALRGLNALEHQPEIRQLASDGLILIPQRRIFIVNDAQAALRKSRLIRRELGLATKFSEVSLRLETSFNDFELRLMASLYKEIYILKYSSENPIYSADFLYHAVHTGLLKTITARCPQGSILGFTSLYENDTTIAAPLLGYKQSFRDAPVYRLLMIELVRYALSKGKRLNWSSGVADFKLLRGGVPTLEYIAVEPGNMVDRTLFAAIARLSGIALRSRLAMNILKT